MRKRVIQLSESEFMNLILEATKQVIQEFDGFTYGRISNGSLAARNDIRNGVFSKDVGTKVNPTDSTKRLSTPLRTIQSYERLSKAKQLDIEIRNDIVNQYKDITFMFLGTNRTKVDEPFEFNLTSIDKIDRDAFIFGGLITWDGKQFNGSIKYIPSKGTCYYTNRSMRLYNYALEPVPPTKQAWDNLIKFFMDSLTVRTR